MKEAAEELRIEELAALTPKNENGSDLVTLFIKSDLKKIKKRKKIKLILYV